MTTNLGLTLPTSTPDTSSLFNSTGNPTGSSSFTGIKPLPTIAKTNNTGIVIPPTTTTVNTGLNQNGVAITSQVPVNTTPSAAQVSTAKPVVIPDTKTSTASDTLKATTDSYMATPPSSYDTTTGFVTPYGLTNGAKPVQPNDPANQTQTGNTGNTNTGTSRDAVVSKILGLDTTLGDQTAERNKLNDTFGTDQKQQAYIDAFNQYNSKKLSYDQQIERIYNTPGGTTAGVQEEAAGIQRRNNADLANLAVITQAAQGNYQASLDIVDRKMKAEFEPVQQQIDNLSQFIQTNNADLTSSQQVALENTRFQLQTNMTNLLTAKQSAHQFALQQGIQDTRVLEAIDAAQTPADVYAAVGGNANGLPQGNSKPNVSPQYAGYQAQTVTGTSYVPQEKLANLTPYQQQEAARQYSAAGIPVLTAGQTVVIQNVDTTRKNLNDLTSVTSKILGSGATGRIGSSIANFLGGTFQTNPDVAAFNNYRQLAIGALKSLGAGTGGSRITAGEIQVAQDNLPTIYDSLETAQKKSAILTSQLDKWQEELLPGSTASNNQQDSGSIFSNSSFYGQ